MTSLEQSYHRNWCLPPARRRSASWSPGGSGTSAPFRVPHSHRKATHRRQMGGPQQGRRGVSQ
eukprot:9406049-Alexandrium_andersonii.AAC.1